VCVRNVCVKTNPNVWSTYCKVTTVSRHVSYVETHQTGVVNLLKQWPLIKITSFGNLTGKLVRKCEASIIQKQDKVTLLNDGKRLSTTPVYVGHKRRKLCGVYA